jgi:hypothetical protein
MTTSSVSARVRRQSLVRLRTIPWIRKYADASRARTR